MKHCDDIAVKRAGDELAPLTAGLEKASGNLDQSRFPLAFIIRFLGGGRGIFLQIGKQHLWHLLFHESTGKILDEIDSF